LIIQDHENDPLTKKVSLPGFVVGGPISFANMAIIVEKDKNTTLDTDETDEEGVEGEEENAEEEDVKEVDLQKWLGDLKEVFESYVKEDDGEIKTNEKDFFKKIANEAKDFDEGNVKQGLNDIFNEINPTDKNNENYDKRFGDLKKKVIHKYKVVDSL